MKIGLFDGIVASSKTRVRCVLCDVHIPKANKCIEQHMNGAKHKEHVNLMIENGVQFINNIRHCKPCKVELPVEDSVLKHVEGDEHANWMAAMKDLTVGEFINLELFLKSNRDDCHCNVCNTSFHCSLQNIEAHVNSIDHRDKIVDYLKPINGIFAVENNDEVWCKVCNVYVENFAHSILEHVDEDDEHLEWLTAIEDVIEDQGISMKSFLANEFDYNAYCNHCHEEIPCNVDDLASHITTESHINHLELE